MTPEIKERIEQIRRGEVPKGYKEASMGTVPVEWDEHRLGNVYIERKGAGDPNLPVLSVSIHSGVSDGELNEDELGKQIKRIADKTQYKTALSGDLVFNMMRAWQGAIGVTHSDGLVSPAYIVARPRDVIFPQFMDYYMKTPRMISTINRQSYGVTDFRKRLYWDSFSPICCILPSSREQQKIAAILTTQDKVIELQQRKIEEVKKLKKSYLSKMFPQKGETVPEIRFPGFTEAWEQRKLGEMGTTFTGLSGKTKDDFRHGDAEFVTYMNVFTNPIAASNGTESVEIDGSQSEVKYGDVFFTTSSETPEEVGMSSIWLENRANVYLNSFCFGWRPTIEIDQHYLAYMLRSSAVRKKFAFLGQGISRYNISKNKVMEMSVPIPRLQEQKLIGEFFTAISNLITLHQRKLEEMQNYKKALMQLLLTGIVRVNV